MAIDTRNMNPSFNKPAELGEYGRMGGGQWYYSHNRPGTKWFDGVNNEIGWTVDFNLTVDGVTNSDMVLNEDPTNGIGVYVNDGTRKETISFLTQEIIFKNANKRVVYDATLETDYRIVGKKNNLELFEKRADEENYISLANVGFTTSSTNSANGLKPVVVEDDDGNFHVIWYDDGGTLGQLYYSKSTSVEQAYGNAKITWSEPVLIVEDEFVQFPDMIIDNDGFIYVSYESKINNYSAIGFVYKNDIGWSSPSYVGIADGDAKLPKLAFDSKYNVCVVWEDRRLSHPEVYFNRFLKDLQKWEDDRRLTISGYGCYRPSVSSYLDDLFISWTNKEEDENSSIQLLKYNILTGVKSSVATASTTYLKADHSSVLVNVKGLVFVVWHDIRTGKYEIYAAIFSPILDITTAQLVVTKSRGGARYPVLSEQQQTGDIYIVWQDYNTNYTEFVDLDVGPYDIRPYEEAYSPGIKPIETDIYIALYDSSNRVFLSSGVVIKDPSAELSTHDVRLSFTDSRSASFPSIPNSFVGELPILYEANIVDRSSFLDISKRFTQIRCALYSLNRTSPIFEIDQGFIPFSDPSTEKENRDFLLTSLNFKKEIRFGDFSNTLNCHYVFKNFKYYLKDAVDPFSLVELSAESFYLDALTAHDATISNYGDIWIVGTCGILFYISKSGTAALVGPGDNYDLEGPIGNISSISFDGHNYMFVGQRMGSGQLGGVYVSPGHIDGFVSLLTADVTALGFNKDNDLYVGTSTGLQVYSTSGIGGSFTISLKEVANSPQDYVTSIQVDENNVVWVGTRNGLYRHYKDRFLKFGISNGLPSMWINDISIRNTAIRYVATSNGIAKMIGSNTDQIMNVENSELWNNNVKSIKWQEPNILWAGTLSKLNQITVDDIEDTSTNLIYEPSLAQIFNTDDLQMYYIMEDEDIITEEDVIEVYVNGNKVSHGYSIGYDSTFNQKIISFHTNLKNDDMVMVLVAKNLKLMADFQQTSEEKAAMGNNLIRVKDLSVIDQSIYLVTEGENSVKINDSNSQLPFDRVHLDTVAPEGTIDIPENAQVDGSIVRVDITADDGITGSGVESMIVSNYPNFTTDGNIPQSVVPFANSVNHDLGLVLGQALTDLNFESGSGSKIFYASGTNELFAGSSKPGALYRYNRLTASWEKLITYDEETFIDFITFYNNNIVVSVGDPIGLARLYLYSHVYGSDGIFQSLSLSLSSKRTFSESRAFCFQELNNKLYIGTGPGEGEEYTSGVGDNGGRLYIYDGINLDVVISDVDDQLYGITSVDGSNLIGCTGDAGYIIELDPINETSSILHNDIEPLVSIEFIKYNDDDLIFTGGISDGSIRRSKVGSSSYDVSFKTIPGKISALKIFNENDTDVLYAAVGKIVYYLSSSGSWVWRYTHNEDISDISFDPNLGNLYVISRTVITKLTPLSRTKNVYLKLIDRAGNETVLYDANGVIKSTLTDDIEISDLANFVNENKIFELTESGKNVFTLRSNSRFYSGDKVEAEQGIYESEIFNGTNDLVKWEYLSWQATELSNTTVQLYVRISDSENDILVEDWVGPFVNSQASGVDIAYLSGQFIQFKAVLTSEEYNISPTLHNITIRAITTEAVHFFTTNFVLPSKITKGILTSRKMLPISADVVFGLNTTNSVDWTDYQEVDENRVFNIGQIGENMRVGIKFISPSRESYDTTDFGEYGPYSSGLYVNTVDFKYLNNEGDTNKYHFRISLYEDYGLENLISTSFSYRNQEGFNVDGEAIATEGVSIVSGEEVDVLFTVPGSANVECDTYYFVKIEAIKNVPKGADEQSLSYELISNDNTFITGCNTSFVDVIDFVFTNWAAVIDTFNFRIKFYTDPERLNEYKTVFSGNDLAGWFVDDVNMAVGGVPIAHSISEKITYRPDLSDFEANSIYYLTIHAYDGSSYILLSNSYTFKARDIQSLAYCGGYMDVPIVKNFAVMVELNDNEFVTLNL